ncbi:MAG: hypothetical protein GX858_03130 [Clostridiales bacterium]|nr:hypothetical protein [Clostridiales bacterium]
MKKSLALLMAVCLMAALGTFPTKAAQVVLPTSALAGLSNNCPNTGIMIPEAFDPLVHTYLLTVASWVSRVIFTPQSADPQAVITVGGAAVPSGQPSQVINMTDAPQLVNISVTAPSGEVSVYSVFLQRRPSEQRNSLSAGYLMGMTENDGKTYLNLDLVSLTMIEGNVPGFVNETAGDTAQYPLSPSCIFFDGSGDGAQPYMSAQEFKSRLKLDGSELFYVVFIQDEIRAILPYDANGLQALRLTSAPDATPIASFVKVTPAPGGDLVTLHEGEMGTPVSDLQKALQSVGYYTGEVDGMYGPDTTNAVLNFQNANKLLQDGIAGDDTQKLLFGAAPATAEPQHTKTGSFVLVTPSPTGEYVTLQEGEMGELVINLQQALKDNGYFKGAVDSFYGPDTKEAIMAFQECHGLSQDGIASPATQKVVFQGKFLEKS